MAHLYSTLVIIRTAIPCCATVCNDVCVCERSNPAQFIPLILHNSNIKAQILLKLLNGFEHKVWHTTLSNRTTQKHIHSNLAVASEHQKNAVPRQCMSVYKWCENCARPAHTHTTARMINMLQFLYPPTFPKTLLHRPTEPFGGTGTYCAAVDAASQSAKEPKIYGFNLKCNNDNECMCAPSAARSFSNVLAEASACRVLRALLSALRAQHALSFSRPVPVWGFSVG